MDVLGALLDRRVLRAAEDAARGVDELHLVKAARGEGRARDDLHDEAALEGRRRAVRPKGARGGAVDALLDAGHVVVVGGAAALAEAVLLAAQRLAGEVAPLGVLALGVQTRNKVVLLLAFPISLLPLMLMYPILTGPRVYGLGAFLATAGATNLLLVTFLIPVSAIILGAAFLAERLEANHFIGMAVIGVGLAAIDGRIVGMLRRTENKA